MFVPTNSLSLSLWAVTLQRNHKAQETKPLQAAQKSPLWVTLKAIESKQRMPGRGVIAPN